MTTALITGVAGQDGSYLSEHLLDLGYDVIGLCRRNTDLWRLQKALKNPNFRIVYGDIADFFQIKAILERENVDEVYNLAAETFVGSSWEQPAHVMNVNGQGAVNVFEAVRQVNPKIRVYQASSSEMFGRISKPADENTPLIPVSPYGAAKAYAHNMARIYRDSYGMHIVCGILFNHESPRRGRSFVTKKIITALKNNDEYVFLGNVSSQRDWGNARHYVQLMPILLNSPYEPKDWVVATGLPRTINHFFQTAKGITGARTQIRISSEFCRPCDIHWLAGNTKLLLAFHGNELPEDFYNFNQLVQEMIDGDL